MTTREKLTRIRHAMAMMDEAAAFIGKTDGKLQQRVHEATNGLIDLREELKVTRAQEILAEIKGEPING
jgi:hypothetical protein